MASAATFAPSVAPPSSNEASCSSTSCQSTRRNGSAAAFAKNVSPKNKIWKRIWELITAKRRTYNLSLSWISIRLWYFERRACSYKFFLSITITIRWDRKLSIEIPLLNGVTLVFQTAHSGAYASNAILLLLFLPFLKFPFSSMATYVLDKSSV